jgi:hypothetical protein
MEGSQPPLPADATTVSLGIECDRIIVRQQDFEREVQVIDMPDHPLDPADPWTLTLRFRVGGQFADELIANSIPGRVTFFYETIGGGPEGQIGPVAFNSNQGVAVAGHPLTWLYNVTSPNQLPGLIPPGKVAKLSAVVRLFGMTGFLEGMAICQEEVPG